MLKPASVHPNWRQLLPVLALLAAVLLSVGVVFAGLPAHSSRVMPLRGASANSLPAKVRSARSSFPGSPLHGADAQPRPAVPQPAQIISRPASSESPDRPDRVLYDQYSGQVEYGISSQNFEPERDIYDDQGADDFQVPQGQAWLIDHVEVAGAYLGSGPADSVTVFFYADGGSVPGSLVFTQSNIAFSQGPNPGDFVIPLNPPASLAAGVYWLSVQANQNFDPSGQWLWRFRQSYWGATARWRNPLGGFGQQFIDWKSNECRFTACYYDYAFRLDGSVAGTPEPTQTLMPTSTGTPPSATPTNTGSPFVPPPVATAASTVQTEVPTATETPPPGCGGAWRVQPVPAPAEDDNYLYGVAALSSNDVWTVGYYYNRSALASVPESFHWNGSAWQSVPMPNPGNEVAELYAVSAASSNDVWAVGVTDSGSGFAHPLIMHWNGTAWSVVQEAGPPPGLQFGRFTAVSARSANDVWAVGYIIDKSSFTFVTLTEHWNGAQWAYVPSPSQGTLASYLTGVTTISSTDAWAVGYYLDAAANAHDRTLTMHWNGTAWSIVPSPSLPGSEDTLLNGVDATSSSNVWAVGSEGDGYFSRALVLRWNGSAWDAVPGPDPVGQASTNNLEGVTVNSPSEVWVAGTYRTPSVNGHTLTARWDGTHWTSVPSPNLDSYADLRAIDSVGLDYVWAVGLSSGSAPRAQAQALLYNDPCATPTPSPSSTSTPTDTPTLTLTPAATHTSTPRPTSTATPTACAINFSDVHPTDYFYEDVRCLYCLGAISGYSDGTFRPFNNTTRGQMTKIIVLALRIPVVTPTGTPTFSDVPPGSPFYDYVETAAANDIVSGYADGTFRPNTNVTRGQICKIVVIAAVHTFGWALDNPAGPSFSDVPPASPFYEYIETLVCHGVISGYSDGTFRPGNNATRAQIAKIVCRTAQNPPDTCGTFLAGALSNR